MKSNPQYLFKTLFLVATIVLSTIFLTQPIVATPVPMDFRSSNSLPASTTIHSFTGLPLTSDGWTNLQALVKSDSRIVYVSTSGNDNTGIYYSPDNSAIGANPFSPTGSILPYATFTTAYKQLRDGYPDIILFKRGDSWPDHAYTLLTKSGRSQTERFIIGAYGDTGALPLINGTSSGFAINANDTVNYLIIADIEMTQSDRAADSEGATGIGWEGAGNHILFEGMYVHGYKTNFAFTDADHVYDIENIVIRRSVIADAWAATLNCLGVYTAYIDSMFLEENLFDHNGWHDNFRLQNTHTRNLYLDHYNTLIVRGNINSRSSSEAAQLRDGGEYSYNLMLQNTSGLLMGHNQSRVDFTGTVKHNVVLDARDIDTSARGYGIEIGNRSNNTLVYDNIIAHQKTGTGSIFGIYISNDDTMEYQEGDPDPKPKCYTINTKIIGNIVYKWDLNGSAGGTALMMGQSQIGITVQNNLFQQPNSAGQAYYLTGNFNVGPDETWIFENNTYYSAANTTPFDGTGLDAMTFNEWVLHVNETGSTESKILFKDPERTIESYAQLRELNPTGYQDGLEKFLQEARKQSRFNWRNEYTSLDVINYIRDGFDREPVSFTYTSP